MMRRTWFLAAGSAVAIAGLYLRAQTPQVGTEEQIARYRNLGKAFYENPTTQGQAVEQFQKALELAPDSTRERVNYGLSLVKAAKTEEGIAELEKAQKQDPSIPHTWFNLGVAFKKDSQYDKAIVQFEQMAKLVPDEPITHYNLGVLYRLANKSTEALREFETAERLNPNLAGPHFQLFNAYRQAGRTEDAAREEGTFQAVKKRQAGAAIPEDLEWSYYSEIFDTLPGTSMGTYPAPKPLQWQASNAVSGVTGAVGMAAADVDDDGKVDTIVWGASGIRFIRAGFPAEARGLALVRDVIHVAVADFNNDGLMDLAVVSKAGVDLYRNTKIAFVKQPNVAPRGAFARAVWVDYDHDYDLDLIVLGEKSLLLRNNGAAGTAPVTFSDESASFPFVTGKPADAMVLDVVPDTDGMDIAVAFSDRTGVIYRDKLAGKYEAAEVPAIPTGTVALAAEDFNNDGRTDLAAATPSSALLLGNGANGFSVFATLTGKGPIAFADFENRGLMDLVFGDSVYQNQPGSFVAAALAEAAQGIAAIPVETGTEPRPGLVVLRADGSVRTLLNRTAGSGSWMRVKLTGVKNLKSSYGAKVELKAGAIYRKRIYRGTPFLAGLGPATQLETVRITWANGMIQNQVRETAGKAVEYKEAPRLSGSCPMIFTWNGKEFQFITDVLGVAPLGASLGDGKYFPVDHDEYIQIPATALAERNGQYEIRITEELKEISYLDQIELVAVDHPRGTRLVTNDKFKSPPFSEFRLWSVPSPRYPQSARDEKGRDVKARLTSLDHSYVDGFPRDFVGRAGMHTLDLDFGETARNGKALLVLNGWTDWADGSTFRAASQQPGNELVMPYLQVKDAQGRWKTVIEDMGIPSGKPKTIAVDLTGKFLSSSREVRIVTNLCVYWDEIYLSDDATAVAPTARLAALQGDLHYRGFSKVVVDPERRQPEAFHYAEVSGDAQWNPTAGFYTRYGEVAELSQRADDQLIIMGSGDELTLRFNSRQLPAPSAGMERDFLLLVDGWAKDADANTAFGKSVEPLPFHSMTSYPFPATEHAPRTSEYEQYIRNYNTRPALTLVRPMAVSMNSTPLGKGN